MRVIVFFGVRAGRVMLESQDVGGITEKTEEPCGPSVCDACASVWHQPTSMFRVNFLGSSFAFLGRVMVRMPFSTRAAIWSLSTSSGRV